MDFKFSPIKKEYKSVVGGVEKDRPFTISVDSKAEGEVFLELTKEGETPVLYPLTGEGERKSTRLTVTTPGLYFYHFLVRTKEGETAYYADPYLESSREGSEWQLTVYEPHYAVPKTFRGGVIYQIFPDRFSIGNRRLKTKKTALYRDDWGGTPEYEADERGIVPNRDMFGGNLYGVAEKLDYLRSLNVKCVYLNPIFEAASNHKYDTGSFRRVDGDFGGEAALDELIKKAKKKGVGILLDGVFSHTGADSVYFNRDGNYDSVGAYSGPSSPYYSWYNFRAFPDDYDCWWGVKILPEVNETNPSYNEFINGEDGIIRSYLRKGIDGWRLDVADELPDSFLSNLVRAAKSVKPDAMILGEVWEDASNKISYSHRRKYLLGEQLDSVTDYPLMNAVLSMFSVGDAAPVHRVVATLVNNYPKPVLDNLMNPLSTHDTPRALTRLGSEKTPPKKADRAEVTLSQTSRERAIRRLKAASALMYALPGVPCIYYGDEAGMEGYEDPFNRKCYPWGNEDESLLAHYRALGNLRALPALDEGEIEIESSNGGVLIFTRGGALCIIANASPQPYALEKPVFDLITKATYMAVAPEQTLIYSIK